MSWTADASHATAKSEYQSFAIMVGRLPKAGTTVTLAVSYMNGNFLTWDEKAVEGQPDPSTRLPHLSPSREKKPLRLGRPLPRAIRHRRHRPGMILGASGLPGALTSRAAAAAPRRQSGPCLIPRAPVESFQSL